MANTDKLQVQLPIENQEVNKTEAPAETEQNPPPCSACFNHLYLLPVLTVIINNGTIITTCTIAYTQKHVPQIIPPFISDTSIHNPERAIFSQGLGAGAILYAVTILVMYLINRMKISQNGQPCWHKINNSSLLFGLVSSIGQGIVSNFDPGTQKHLHYIGAFCGFVSGTIVYILQGIMSYWFQSRNPMRKKVMCILQISFPALLFISEVIFACCVIKYYTQDTSTNPLIVPDDLVSLYQCGAVAEWIVAFFFSICLLTFLPELKKHKLLYLQVRPKSDQNPHV